MVGAAVEADEGPRPSPIGPVTVSASGATVGERMPYVIDTIEVEPAHVTQYLEAVQHLGVPVMTDAGAIFVSCATTSSDIGENVAVQIVWGFENHEDWNLIRRNMVLDRRWYEYGRKISALRLGGTRRIYHGVGFSPS
jgi:hypothetical protein